MYACGLVLLAAGSSNRLGQPKQLLLYKERTLLEYMIQTASASLCREVLVVLGANSEEILAGIEKTQASIVHNKDWGEGMASSIRCGLAALATNFSSIDGVIFMVCDQPFVSTDLLNSLINKRLATGKSIIASAYNNTIGIPALFDKSFFPELLLLKGQEGAKKIIMQHGAAVETIPFPMGYMDIDTVEDYEKIKNKE